MKLKHKIFSLLLMICMLVTCMPTTMQAAEMGTVKFTDTIIEDLSGRENCNWSINVNYTEEWNYVNTEIFVSVYDHDSASRFDLNALILEAIAGLEYAMTSEEYTEYYDSETRAEFDDNVIVDVYYEESEYIYMCSIPALSADVVNKLAACQAKLDIFTPEFEAISWAPVTGTTVFNVETATVDAITNRMKDVDVKYMTYYVQGADAYVYNSESLREDFFTYNAETDKVSDWTPEWETMYIAEKYLYTYNAEKDMFVLCPGNDLVSYQKYVITPPLEDGSGYAQASEYYNVVFEKGAFAAGAGYYVVADSLLPESVTTEKKEPTPSEPEVPVEPGTPSEPETPEVPTVPEKEEIKVETEGFTTPTEMTNAMTGAMANAQTGDVVKVEVPAAVTVIEKDAFVTAKEKGVAIEVKAEKSDATDEVSWSFENITEAVDFVPTIKMDANVTDIQNTMQSAGLDSTMKYTTVKFNHSGKLPGKAKVALNLTGSSLETEAAEGLDVYLYYFNPSQAKYELTDTAKVANKAVVFTMEHCSDYIISTTQLPDNMLVNNNSSVVTPQPEAPVTPPVIYGSAPSAETVTSPKTGDVSAMYLVMIMAAACGVVVLTKNMKKVK